MKNEIIVLGNMYDSTNKFMASGRVYSGGGIAPTIGASHFGMEKYILDKQIVAMRGRNPDNPSQRTKGLPTEQRLEKNSEGICNCITTVQKDNLVMEKEMVQIKQATKDGYIECKVGGVVDLSYPNSTTRRGRVIDKGNTSPTLQTSGNICKIEEGELMEKYRVRKLTPKESFRLMNFDDADFYATESVNSDSQLYKQAGNSIVVSCLCAIFSQLNIKGITPWNKMEKAEIDRLTAVNKCNKPEIERNPI